MRFVSFIHEGVDRIGVRRNDTEVIAIDDLPGNDPLVFPTMIDLISQGSVASAHVLTLLENPDRQQVITLDDIGWRPPVPNPGKIVGVAMNNSASNERKISAPDHPAYFLKPPSCLIGHQAAIHIRPYYGSVHPEPELAVVIGRMTCLYRVCICH